MVAQVSVNPAAIVTKLRQLRLNRAHRCIGRGLIRACISRLVIVIVRGVVIVVVRVSRIVIGIVAGVIIRVTVIVVRIVIPRIVSGIQSPPEATDKHKDLIIVEMCMVPVPISAPVSVMTLGSMVFDE